MKILVLVLMTFAMVGVGGLRATVERPAPTALHQAESPIGSEDPFVDSGEEEDGLDELSRLGVYILVVVVVGLVGWMLSS